MRASPYAQKLAREAGVDISQAAATGPEGRIVAADVEKLISSGGGKAAAQKPEAKGKPSSQESQSTSEVSHRSTLQTCAVFRLHQHHESYEDRITNPSNSIVDLQQALVYTHHVLRNLVSVQPSVKSCCMVDWGVVMFATALRVG